MSVKIRQIAAVNNLVQLLDSELEALPPSHLRVRVMFSGVSAGTELLCLSFPQKPGDPPAPLGYQAVGEVEEVASGMDGTFAKGDVVACYGGPYVKHASHLNVPKNLAVKLPAGCDPVEASYCALGTIAMQAFRNGRLSLGETAGVLGLGVLGNLTAQIAQAAGCRTVGLDLLELRRNIGRECGIEVTDSAEAFSARIKAASDGNGADTIFLVVTKCNDETLAGAVELLRLQGKVVIVGTSDAKLPREPLFYKEASIMVSRAGGPGRYDGDYEFGGHDYPYAFARWTEGRNLAEFIRLLSTGSVKVRPFISDIMSPADAPEVYHALQNDPGKHVGVVYDWSKLA